MQEGVPFYNEEWLIIIYLGSDIFMCAPSVVALASINGQGGRGRKFGSVGLASKLHSGLYPWYIASYITLNNKVFASLAIEFWLLFFLIFLSPLLDFKALL